MGKINFNIEEFIKKATEKFGDKYTYDKVKYVNSKTPIIITCPKHGDFKKTIGHFLSGQGCPVCSGRVHYTQETFIAKAKSIHPEYDYSKSIFKTTSDKLVVTCPEHSDFEITPNHLFAGQGCPKCRYIKSANSKRRSLDEVIKLANEVHENKYDYSQMTEYKNDREKYPIVCPEHGIFYMSMNAHIKAKQGCPVCGKSQSIENRTTTFEEFKKKANKIHKGFYTYPEGFTTLNDKITIICPKHGEFKQKASNHLNGQGCPLCKNEKISQAKTSNTDEFIEKARKIQGDKYDYSQTEYINNTKHVKIICPQHGAFYQTPSNHLQGYGCPKCTPLHSKCEDEIYNFLANLLGEDAVIQRDRIILAPKEIDIYIPSLKIGIEYDGLYWHSEMAKDMNYHLQKTEECEKKGIRLIHIFEDEWREKKDIVKSILCNIIGKTEQKIYARKCVIKEVSAPDSSAFLDGNHLQGRCPCAVKLGLYYNDELVSLMCFGKSRHFIGNGKTEWELLRFCNKINFNIVGAASKLLKHFIEKYDPHEIVSYADRRISVGNLYERLEFTLHNKSRPNYFYIIDNERKYRFNFRKSILVKKYECPEYMSEHEFCLSKKWYRIYDCGCLCYKWKKKNEETNN